MNNFGQRELKKAKTKLECLKAMHTLSKNRSFKDIKVKDIASAVAITEMTFFNYFKTKEELLLYYMRMWCLDQMAAQLLRPLMGYAAIYRIFLHTSNEIKAYPTIMLSLIGYIASLHEKPTLLTIEPAEIYLRHPDLSSLQNADILDFDHLMLNHLKEIELKLSKQETLNLLRSAFYGDAINAHMTDQETQSLYELSLNTIFKRE